MKRPYLGAYYIPETRLINSIRDIDIINKNVGERETSTKEIASLWKYSSITTPTLFKRINSLVAFGFLSGRGKYVITDLGSKISETFDDNRKRELMRMAFLNVPLWKELFNRFQKDKGRLPNDNLTFHLSKIAGVPYNEAKKVEDEVREDYANDIAQISVEEGEEGLTEGLETAEPQKHLSSGSGNTSMAQQLVQKSIMDNYQKLEFGEALLYLPKQNLRKEWEKLKKYMVIFLEDYNESTEEPQESQIENEPKDDISVEFEKDD